MASRSNMPDSALPVMPWPLSPVAMNVFTAPGDSSAEAGSSPMMCR
jgi:hypothetical protein